MYKFDLILNDVEAGIDFEIFLSGMKQARRREKTVRSRPIPRGQGRGDEKPSSQQPLPPPPLPVTSVDAGRWIKPARCRQRQPALTRALGGMRGAVLGQCRCA
jgi:hypothetical protein